MEVILNGVTGGLATGSAHTCGRDGQPIGRSDFSETIRGDMGEQESS